jgi:acetoin utilization protein AcuB
MRVKEIMTGNVTTIRSTASCQEAVALMFREKIRHLPVVDEAGRLVGIVTDRDLRHRLFEPSVFPTIGSVPVETLLGGVPVSEVMSRPVVTARVDDALEDAARLMLEDKVGSLPVLDGARVAGIITETDLLRRIVQADACCREVGTIIVSYP